MNEPIVTIILPVYNVEKFVVDCLRSIQVQSYTDYELLIIDDGSTDTSREKIENFIVSNEFKNCKYFYKENGGLSSARNFGLHKSRGKYIWFIDSDDLITPDSLNYLVETITMHDADVIRGKYIEFTTYPIINETSEYDIYNNGLNYVKQCIKDKTYQIVVCTSLIKRQVFEKYHLSFEEGIFFEDQCFTVKLLLNEQIKIIDSKRVVYLYRKNISSISNTFSLKKAEDLLYVVKSLYKLIEEKNFLNDYQKKDFYALPAYAFSYFTYIYNHCSRIEQEKLKKQIDKDVKIKILLYNSKRIQTDIQNKLFFLSPNLVNVLLTIYRKIVATIKEE